MEKSVILITGCPTRLTRKIGISLTNNNYLVIVHCNKSKDEALSLKNEISDLCMIIQYDFLFHEMNNFFNQVVELFGQIDYVINTVSIFIKYKFDEINKEILEKYNLRHSTSSLLFIISLYEHLIARVKKRATINITDASLSGSDIPTYYNYEASTSYPKLDDTRLSNIANANLNNIADNISILETASLTTTYDDPDLTNKPSFTLGGSWTNDSKNKYDIIEGNKNSNEIIAAQSHLNSPVSNYSYIKINVKSDIDSLEFSYFQLEDNIKITNKRINYTAYV